MKLSASAIGLGVTILFLLFALATSAGSLAGESVSATIWTDSGSAASADPATTTQTTDWGSTITTQIGAADAPEVYRWQIELSANQHLEQLSNGAVAMVEEDGEAPPELSEDSDYLDDTTPDDPENVAETEVEAEDPDGTDEILGQDDGVDDPPVPIELPGDPDPSDAAYGELLAAQEEAEGIVDAVLAAPTVADSTGAGVPATLSFEGTVVTLTVSHRTAEFKYPVAAVNQMVVEWNEPPEVQAAPPGPQQVEGDAPDACSTRAQIVSYNPVGWNQLLTAFKAYPTRCADYYIDVSPSPQNKRGVRAGAAQEICAANADPAIQAAGARVFPVAQFHYGEWRQWVRPQDGPNARAVRERWYKAGRTFRASMNTDDAGYGRACTATPGFVIPPRWSINEFGSTFTVQPQDRDKRHWYNEPAMVRSFARYASSGLFHGAPGGADDKSGIPFLIDPSHTRLGFSVYKPGLRKALMDRSFWNPMKRYALLWGQEAFVYCWKTCIKKQDGTAEPRAKRAKNLNAYALHPVRFSYKGGTDSREARTFFVSRYVPLMTAYWGLFDASEVRDFYGGTTDLGEDRAHGDSQMKGLVSLETYSVRRFAAGGGTVAEPTLPEDSTATSRYPNRRIGFAWHEVKRPPDPIPPDSDFARNQAVADRLAKALQAAYGPSGTALGACRQDDVAGYWCERSVAKRLCPERKRTVFMPCWITNFSNWESPPVKCRPACPA